MPTPKISVTAPLTNATLYRPSLNPADPPNACVEIRSTNSPYNLEPNDFVIITSGVTAVFAAGSEGLFLRGSTWLNDEGAEGFAMQILPNESSSVSGDVEVTVEMRNTIGPLA